VKTVIFLISPMSVSSPVIECVSVFPSPKEDMLNMTEDVEPSSLKEKVPFVPPPSLFPVLVSIL